MARALRALAMTALENGRGLTTSLIIRSATLVKINPTEFNKLVLVTSAKLVAPVSLTVPGGLVKVVPRFLQSPAGLLILSLQRRQRRLQLADFALDARPRDLPNQRLPNRQGRPARSRPAREILDEIADIPKLPLQVGDLSFEPLNLRLQAHLLVR